MSAKASRRLRNALVVVLALAAVYVAYRYTLHRMVEAKLDEIRQQGYPVTLAELDKWYPQPPPGENAADIYLTAFAKFNRWDTNTVEVLGPPPRRYGRSKSDRQTSAPGLVLTTVKKRDLLPLLANGTKLPPRTEALSNSVQILIADYLADNAEPLELLHKAALFRKCRYPIDLTKGFALLLPHLNEVRTGTRLLALKAILKSEEGDSEAAGDAIIDGFASAHSLEKEPLLISQLVHGGCQGIALAGLERMLNRTTPSDAVLTRLAAATSSEEASQTMVQGVAGEISFHESVFIASVRELTKWIENGDLWLPAPSRQPYVVASSIALYRATGLMDADQLSLLNGLECYVAASRQPPHLRVVAGKACGRNADHLSQWRVISRAYLPSFSTVYAKEATAIARLCAASVALAIERYSLANDALPRSLSDLVPKFLDAVPSDPFDGQPLRYKKLAKGYVVYSVGEDGKDDGGVEPRGSFGAGTDITFIVER